MGVIYVPVTPTGAAVAIKFLLSILFNHYIAEEKLVSPKLYPLTLLKKLSVDRGITS